MDCISGCVRNYHVNDKLTCPFCRHEWVVPNNGFPTNVSFQKILDLPISSKSCDVLPNNLPVPVFTTHVNKLPDLDLSSNPNLYLAELKPSLERKDPPMNLSDLDSEEIFCAYINHRWQRVKKATVGELEFNRTDMLEVFCVDSGKTHALPLNLIRTLDIPGCEPMDGYEARFICDCPLLARQFVLVDVIAPFNYTTFTRQWSELAIQYLKVNVEDKIWEAIPVAMYGEHQGVRLIDSSNQLLANLLKKEKYGGPAVFEHCEGELPYYAEEMFANMPRLVFFKSPFRYPSQKQPTPRNQQVRVVYVDDSSGFSLHLQEESRPSIEDPRVGFACVAKYEKDDVWYREQILKICEPLRAIVLFVDYGNTQLVPIEEIKSIDEEFMKQPSFAYHCRLGRVASFRVWTIDEIQEFEGRTRTKVSYATFTIPDSEGKYPVRLVEETATAVIVFNEEFAAPRYKSRSVPDKPISVVVGCYPVKQLERLEKFYSALSPDDLHEDLPRPGTPCVARFDEDGRYYRAEIIRIVADGFADVSFVDYGN
ncbi:hypothetical protein DAPPUDRAFT_315375 [Daphnia pulex]|uniref:Tudor domain-containing protein n=1 Tax=Daphnia pulex TaxID=6669 RepID=E9G9K2_DAPPU|nr:hypothetical protein DAPPUDRAFT_315375 [Daphnia pulex]|eukprot:EFX83579.1 hypothetical protein DAPPUDRAFT_315375 [Daphnia pulex]